MYIGSSVRIIWIHSYNNNNNNNNTILVQTILRKKFWSKKLRVNAGYVSNMKKLLTT